MRQRDVRVGMHFLQRQDVFQALACFRSQSIIMRLDIFSAQTQGQVSAWQPLHCVFQLQVNKKHGANDLTDDKSQIFVCICSQQHWSCRFQHSNVEFDFPGTARHKQNTRRHVLLSVRKGETKWCHGMGGESKTRTCVHFLNSLQQINASHGHCGSRVENKLPSRSKLTKLCNWQNCAINFQSCSSLSSKLVETVKSSRVPCQMRWHTCPFLHDVKGSREPNEVPDAEDMVQDVPLSFPLLFPLCFAFSSVGASLLVAWLALTLLYFHRISFDLCTSFMSCLTWVQVRLLLSAAAFAIAWSNSAGKWSEKVLPLGS